MQENGIQPEIKLPEELVFCELDADAVNRIFSNIINNALKYSDGDLSVIMGTDGRITFPTQHTVWTPSPLADYLTDSIPRKPVATRQD